MFKGQFKIPEDKKHVAQKILSYLIERSTSLKAGLGYQLSPDALLLLIEAKEPLKVLDYVLKVVEEDERKPLIIDRQLVEAAMVKAAGPTAILKEVSPQPPKIAPLEAHKPLASGVELVFDVVQDPTRCLSPRGSVNGFNEYFVDRYRRLRKVFMERLDVRDAAAISDVLSLHEGKVKALGMVLDKRESKAGGFLLDLEDEDASVRVIIPAKNIELVRKASRVVADEVLCIEGFLYRGFILAQGLHWPDIPSGRSVERPQDPIYAALTSDLHIGSRYFLHESFNKFLSWLKGRAEAKEEGGLAGAVKYVIIAGDIIDGVGVYPGQEKELMVKDPFKQYEEAAKYIKQIPEYIQVIIIPGNHDVTRQALPCPAIFKEYAEPLYELPNVTMLGDPAYFKLHGVRFLVSHGVSLQDIIEAVPGLSFDKPEEAMAELLKKRHLAPIYGKNTPIAPEPKDFMVIESTPDVFHAGHVHTRGIKNYQEVLIVNSGAWQEETSYQKLLGIKPATATISLVNLKTLEPKVLSFPP